MHKLTQLIDYEGNFQPEVFTYAKGISGLGFDYSVITVLGCQSSGKSTLLNALFNTSFDVMDAARGKSQTTKGLWLASTQNCDTLIVDVEGTDSKERGEDRFTFEHRAALFSLALADVVLVNMWYNDLGRYTASNYGLLKTVLAVNLELFQQEKEAPKTVMMFVIRDYFEEQTPLEKLEEMIQADLRQIWSEIPKPPHLENSKAQDFFVFKTYGIPSKFSHPQKFNEKVVDLRNRFYHECRPASYSRKIPADGFALYAQNIWKTILHAKDLDIPSQKEMLATFRCEELRACALDEALKDLPNKLAAAKEGKLPSDDFTWAQNVLDYALELYDSPASRYHSDVCHKVRQQLLSSVNSAIQSVIDAQLSSVRQSLVKASAETLSFLFGGEGPKTEQWSTFGETVNKWRIESLSHFDSKLTSMSLHYTEISGEELQVMEFNADLAREALIEVLDNQVERQREKQVGELEKAVRELMLSKIGVDLDGQFGSTALTAESFWVALHEQIQLAKGEADANYRAAWLGLQHGSLSHDELWNAEAYRCALCVTRDRLGRVCEWLQNHVLARFQAFFTQDEEGAPRQWQEMKSDTIKECFVAAKGKALDVIVILESCQCMPRLSATIDESVIRENFKGLLSTAQKEAVIARATRKMQQACREAQLVQATGLRGANIPWWMWLVLLVLGYNEMTAVLFSPIMLVLVMIGGAVAFLAYLTGNFTLPIDLARHAAGMVAGSLLSVLQALQGLSDSRPHTGSTATQ